MRRDVGDLRGLGELRFPFTAPFVTSCSRGDGISILKLSLDMEKCLPPPVAEVGEASGDELDMLPGIVRLLYSFDFGCRMSGLRSTTVSVIESKQSLCVTFACEENEGKGLLIRVPYLFWREIDYLPRALADKGGTMLQG